MDVPKEFILCYSRPGVFAERFNMKLPEVFRLMKAHNLKASQGGSAEYYKKVITEYREEYAHHSFESISKLTGISHKTLRKYADASRDITMFTPAPRNTTIHPPASLEELPLASIPVNILIPRSEFIKQKMKTVIEIGWNDDGEDETRCEIDEQSASALA